ncbi:MAG: LacI family transcriptional regulator, partial [Lachnospiraceae bacterium]|nr:LacI family transcriptional regulator [Lachnospiraceae bacterium]
MGQKSQTCTIDDVAKMAGVSTATVGRVIGNYGSVSNRTRKKVLEAVEELDYVPNTIAQGLRNRSTKTIAVVVGNIKNNYCSQLVYAIEREAQKFGYNVLICNTNENLDKEIQHLQTIRSRRVDGLILISVYSVEKVIPDKYHHLYDGQSIPTVFVDRNIMGLKKDLIQSNNEEISYEATKYLLSLGHTRIGVIGTVAYSTVQDRLKGFRRAMQESSVEVDSSMIVDAEYVESLAGQKLAARLLDEHPDLTAFYVLNNTLCGSVLLELKKRGLSTPEDISILTWDDDEINELFDITTVVQHVEEIGRRAVKRIFELMENPDSEVCTQMVDAQLLIRKSGKDIRGG